MKILKKIHLTNWHYINFYTMELNRELNFFTGHSGSGKSTIVDALQLVLLGDTRGEYFFNKAAREDADRRLIEYLRGMQSETEHETKYLRNTNFSTYIVLEFLDTKKNTPFCLGIVFDVDTKLNSYNHIHFYINEKLSEDKYLENEIPLTIKQFRLKYKTKAQLYN